MVQTTNTTQVYSPFGSGYVPEGHDPDRVHTPKPFHHRRGVVVATSLFAVFTVAGAIAAATWKSDQPEIWTQEAPASVLKLPGGFGMDDAVY